jgi:bifunctional non-homologous end joining protein LigD
VHEIKDDGYRLIARRDAAGVRLLTRNGHDWTYRYPTAQPRSHSSGVPVLHHRWRSSDRL